ncbi:DegT/DnrJ/EryC1/StrS family aminotransferase [Haloferax profundi]|uniref:Aminotransferase DegT n=1 Tax=Haloferax profundi TaxID=1544718 RepID=A0A0W1SKS6_9EURY|nr:DegT/DnrJ/EryC1/StrS family aminotransferase [Haloferax profundi]KTG26872.1 hypothetical protein AUR66_15720 [Haloferax profundi]
MFIPLDPNFKLRWVGKPDPLHPSWVDDPNWVPRGHKQVYAHARTGLYAILDALGTDGGTVMLPAYLPESAVWPFREHGYEIVYYPISADLTYPEQEIEALIHQVEPDVVLFVHYLGFADSSFDSLAQTASSSGAFVIEDCARGLFSRDEDGKLLGTTGDAAVYSAHKTLPAPFGGIVVSRTHRLEPPVSAASETKELLRLTGMWTVNHLNVRKQLRRLNGRATPRPFEEDLSEVQPMPATSWPPLTPGRLSRIGLHHAYPLRVRSERSGRYNTLRLSLLDTEGVDVLTPVAHDTACPYGVAIRVREGPVVRNRIYNAIRSAGLPAERYIWGLKGDGSYIEQFPRATHLRESIIVLPTHQQLPWESLPLFGKCIETVLDEKPPRSTTSSEELSKHV